MPRSRFARLDPANLHDFAYERSMDYLDEVLWRAWWRQATLSEPFDRRAYNAAVFAWDIVNYPRWAQDGIDLRRANQDAIP